MRSPALQVLLAAFVVVALAGGVGLVAGSVGSDPVPAEPTTLPVGTSAAAGDVRSVEQPSTSRVASDGTLSVEFSPRAETDLRIHLEPDRDADWEVVVRYELTDSNETAVFERVGERFLAGELGPSETPFERFAEGASRNVDRQMRVEDVEREVVLHEEDLSAFEVDEDVVAVGEYRLTFMWTEFLEEDGENLVLGDALATPTDGTWLRSLEADQSIEVKTPAGYTVSGTPGATLPLRDNAVVIDGPRSFDEDERVAIVYSPTGGGPSTPPWTLLAAAIVVAALLIAGGLLGYRRFDSDDGGAAGGAASTGTSGAAGGGADAAAGDDPTSADAAGGGGSGAAGGGAGGEPEEDLSLLSDEERVERLLEHNGGRMRQADIVGETGWSDAKVSQLLSAMADAGRVEKLRLGRENLISLPDGEGGDDAGGGGSGEAGSEAA